MPSPAPDDFGVRTTLRLEPGVRPADSLIVAETWQDVEPILDRNKELRSIPQKSDWGRHVASIPNVILHQWLNEEYASGNTHLRLFTREFDETVIAKKLKDPNYAYLLTSGPKHSVGYGD